MDGLQFDDLGSSRVLITILSIAPVRAGKLFAFASVEVDIDGLRFRNSRYPRDADHTPPHHDRATDVSRRDRCFAPRTRLARGGVRRHRRYRARHPSREGPSAKNPVTYRADYLRRAKARIGRLLISTYSRSSRCQSIRARTCWSGQSSDLSAARQ